MPSAALERHPAGPCAPLRGIEFNLVIPFWALRHAPGKPDFHHRDAFALELDEVRH